MLDLAQFLHSLGVVEANICGHKADVPTSEIQVEPDNEIDGELGKVWQRAHEGLYHSASF